jgi:hypothetical protein
MTKLILTSLMLYLVSACGGSGGNDATSTSSKACTDTAVLGQATFGSGCFK